MTSTADIETADRLTRRRARMLPLLAVLFLSQQSLHFAGKVLGGSRADDPFWVAAAWMVLSIVLLLLMTTGGAWFRSASVRALLDDEVTRQNRADGLGFGFVAAMVGGVVLYFMTLFGPLPAQDVIHIMMMLGLASALVRFAYLERRALRNA
jgi:hypothetical protein